MCTKSFSNMEGEDFLCWVLEAQGGRETGGGGAESFGSFFFFEKQYPFND